MRTLLIDNYDSYTFNLVHLRDGSDAIDCVRAAFPPGIDDGCAEAPHAGGVP